MAGIMRLLAKNNLKVLINAFSDAPTAPGKGMEETASDTND